MVRNSSATIVAPSLAVMPSHKRSLHESPCVSKPEYPLSIERLPDSLQLWDKPRYSLIHVESGLRVPGTWSLSEAQRIQKTTKNWDWSIDKNRVVGCAANFMALAEKICHEGKLAEKLTEKHDLSTSIKIQNQR